jgi:putative ABC transport system permease protein
MTWRQARRRTDTPTIAEERNPSSWRWNPLETLFKDARFGFRQLRRNPAFTTVATATLALGIGATTAVFSVVNAVLLQPLPFREPGRLIQLFETEDSPGNFPLSGADYLDWQALNRTLEATSLFSAPIVWNASGPAEPEPVTVVSTQANFFDVLGVMPVFGRTFVSGDDTSGKNRVAIVSRRFLQRHFGNGIDGIGKSVILNNESYTIVGVMPSWLNLQDEADIWTPLDTSPKGVGSRDEHSWYAIGRLKTGISLARAREDLLAISNVLEKQYPNSNNRVHAVLIPLNEVFTGASKTPLLILLGAVTLVLLLACVNAANLQLARATSRRREMAVRSSLGAGRLRLVRQMLTESILLALAGAAIGILGAWRCVRLIESATAIPIPRSHPEIDRSVLLFTVVVSVLVGVSFGLAPALQTSRLDLSRELKAGAGGIMKLSSTRWKLRDSLVVAEISLTFALLVGAGLLLRSYTRLRSADIGMNPHDVLTILVNLPKSKYPTLVARRNLLNRLVDRVRIAPGVEFATVSTEIPLQGETNGYIQVDGQAGPPLSNRLVGWNFITPDYFRTFEILFLEGNTFSPEDIERAAASTQKVAEMNRLAPSGGRQMKTIPGSTIVSVISQSMARAFWQAQNPIGRSFRWNDMTAIVVGVVGDVKEYGIRTKTIPQAYLPLPVALTDTDSVYLTMKSRIAKLTMLETIRQQIRTLDTGLALFRPRSMDEVLASDIQDAGVQAFLVGAFATAALALAIVGLYGVTSYLVNQRTREIGIRMALGAQQSAVLGSIMKKGIRLTTIGMLLGALVAFGLTHFISSLLYNVGPADPLTYAVVAALITIVALGAYYIPARRATTLDPLKALRCEQ